MLLDSFLIIHKVLFIILIQACFKLLIYVNCQDVVKNKAAKFDKEALEKEHLKSLLISRNVTRILDQLLKGYDKRLRPNYAGPPITIGITININNINSVSEVNMDYTMDVFLRQMWTDKRLSFDGASELVIGSDMLHKIWLPDTYIANDRKTYFHKATVQNKFIRIKPDGSVLYSMRLTVTAACPMDFQYFPMDHQSCDLDLESYGFRMEDIRYKWAQGLNASFNIEPTIELPQLKYKSYKLVEREFKLSTGLYSRLTMRLYFLRSLVYYIIQIYIPSTLIVVLSWVSFWLDRTAAPARVSLGITTVLTMVTFIWSTNASLPKISYVKSIDVFLVCCFLMTFASVIEYAMVSYIHIKNERRKRKKRECALQQVADDEQQRQQNQIMANERLDMLSLTESQTNIQNNEMGRRSTSRAAGINETEENIQMMMLDRDDSVAHQLNTSINRRINTTNKESYIDDIANNEQSVIWDKNNNNKSGTRKCDDKNIGAETSFHDPRSIQAFKKYHVCQCPHHGHHHHHNHNHNQHQTHNEWTDFHSHKQSKTGSNPNLLVLRNGGGCGAASSHCPHQHGSSNPHPHLHHHLHHHHHHQQMSHFNDNMGAYNSKIVECGDIPHRNVVSLQRYRSLGSINTDNNNKRGPYADLGLQHRLPSNLFNATEITNDSSNPYNSSISSRKKRQFCCTCRIKAAKIDHVSRVIFPVTFMVFHIIYWTYYLRISGSTLKEK